MKFLACKHLIFDPQIIDSRCTIEPLHGDVGCYWKRPPELALDGNTDCQFCELRGRLHGKVTCLEGMAACELYEQM